MSPTSTTTAAAAAPPVVKRRQKAANGTGDVDAAVKNQYRCSLINLENSQDEELDAILGELSVLESQFTEELATTTTKTATTGPNGTLKKQESTGAGSPTESHSSGMHSRSSSGGSNGAAGAGAAAAATAAPERRQPATANGKRTDSPDNDSAFCDNLSVLSSCSAASSSRLTSQSKSSSTSGVSSNHHSPTSAAAQQEDQEARIKAEKIKLAIEKIKEASIKKLFVKVFTADGSAKSLLIDEKMTVGHVTRILAEKNHVKLDPKWGLVELVPDLYMERAYEDHENLVENCLMWKVDSKNTLWFIERPEKYDLFGRPELYLLGSSSSQRGDLMEEHSRQELLEEYFSSSGVGAPEVEGFIWLKAESKKSWKKFYFVLRSSGLYYAPKGKKSSKDLVCLSTFDVNQVYYGAGWKKKYKAPSEFCFAIKHPQIQAKTPKYIRYLCVDTERELHQWVTGIRIAKNGRQMYDNYRSIEEEITHADIDILTSKRYSVNSPNSLPVQPGGTATTNNGAATKPTSLASPVYQMIKTPGSNPASPARTPSSENKSLDSALSSGIVSDMSQCSTASISSTSVGEIDHAGSESGSQNTPVNTIERAPNGNASDKNSAGQYAGINGLRRSLSRSSKSSSSSGCLSDRSGTPAEHFGGFESDFPAGGTIKKRPSVNPRIPLTNTTWGLVRGESDEDLIEADANDQAGPNVRVGGGGTLLRSAVRQSFRKASQEQQQQQRLVTPPPPAADSSIESSTPEPVRHHQVTAQIHAVPNGNVDPLSEAFESSLVEDFGPMPPIEDLPPPPRDESLDQLAMVGNSAMTSSVMSMDDLPPPPPEIYHEDAKPNNYAKPPPAPLAQQPLPPSLKRAGPVHQPQVQQQQQQPALNSPKPNPGVRRISFDDNVQLIGENRTETLNLPPYLRRPEMPPPNKLYHDQSQSQAAPPRAFLQDLQRVMKKKWQVAEKCRTEPNSTPHAVLGFRDEQLVQHQNAKEESVGAWVLQQQNFANPPMMAPMPPPQQEPLYAMAARNSPSGRPPMHYSPPSAMVRQSPQPQPKPVILREPTPPEYDPYAALNEMNGYHQHQQKARAGGSDVVSNYSTVSFNNGRVSPASPMRLGGRSTPTGGRPPAPPPPRRSQNTHLTSAPAPNTQ